MRSAGTPGSAPPVNRCPRCDGLLYVERICASVAADLFGFENWACANCGNRLDTTILKNRKTVPKRIKNHVRALPLLLTC